MRDFRVGDRVRVVGTDEDGYTGTITDVRKETHYTPWPFDVAFDNGASSLFKADELELIEQEMAGEELDAAYGTVSLEPRDPFEKVLIDIVATNRAKRKDYAVDGSPFSNFDDTARAMGGNFTALDSVNFNIAQKEARLRSLKANGRTEDPQNESLTDTYLDRAVYSVIALAILRYPDGKVV